MIYKGFQLSPKTFNFFEGERSISAPINETPLPSTLLSICLSGQSFNHNFK